MRKDQYNAIDVLLMAAKDKVMITKATETDKAQIQLYEQLEMRLGSAIRLNRQIYSRKH
jgi:hypothetical protein